jgi:subtilisin family serine protease
MTRRFVVMAAALMAVVMLVGVSPGDAAGSKSAKAKYLVLYRDGASLGDAHAAIRDAGGSIIRENTGIGLASVVTRNASFRQSVKQSDAIEAVGQNRIIGYAPPMTRSKRDNVETDRTVGKSTKSAQASQGAAVNGDPLSGIQWDMQMINATEDGSYAAQLGDPRVIVADIDTGLDGHHPDLAPNFNASLSRNWTTDIPEIDGPCEEEPDQSCHDPVDVDEGDHGTHTAGTIAAALNGLGIAGVAPGVTIINDRAGQDSGFFFLQETVNAITYAGDVGADVANMSFYTDPWLYNCVDNPADSPEAQEEQQMTIEAINRATTYAHRKGVTLVAAMGNEHTDLGNPTFDDTSPDYPLGTSYPREVDNSCVDLPTEARYVLSVSALGPTERKAYYSNYGVEQTFVSAPGGDRREYFGTPQYNSVENRVLSTYPEQSGIDSGQIDPATGEPTTPFVVRDCKNGVCAYYTYFQGTSMASPHAAGVAALIVSQFGHSDPNHPGGLTLAPKKVKNILANTARNHACPSPRLFHYPDPDLDSSYDAYCAGTANFNGFYGNGIVDALHAVGRR